MRRALFLSLVLLACDKGEAPVTKEPAAPAKPAPVDTFGGPVTASLTPLSTIVASPGSYKGKTIATSGVIKKVCQERGCWMSINADGKDAMIRMHDHAFFVPTDSQGRRARVQGTVVLMKDGRECEESNAEDVQVELDATGVELAAR